MSDTDIAAYVREHPRMMGVLFTLTVLLTQAGSVSAGIGSTIS